MLQRDKITVVDTVTGSIHTVNIVDHLTVVNIGPEEESVMTLPGGLNPEFDYQEIEVVDGGYRPTQRGIKGGVLVTPP